jgi:hypothetical protein
MNKAGLLLIIIALVCFISFLGGCCNRCHLPECFEQDSRPGLLGYEADQRICRSVRINIEEMAEDWDHLWLVEKPSRNSWLRVK